MQQEESPPVASVASNDTRRSSAIVNPSQPSNYNTSIPPTCQSEPSSRTDDESASQGDESPSPLGSYSSSGASSSNPAQQYLHAAFHNTSQHQSGGNQLPPPSSQSQPQPAATNNGRQRATSLMAPNQIPQRLIKNYKELARDFRMLKPFTRLPDGTYPMGTRCVFCEIGAPKTVFFPCQHKCVCDMCIKLHDVSSDRSRASAWSSCPVCMTDIRLMLPYSGKEEEEYWKWISEVKPSLPSTFKLEFKDAAKRLKKGAVLPDAPSGEQAPPMLARKPSNRRHTWHSTDVQRATAGHASDMDPKTCSIL